MVNIKALSLATAVLSFAGAALSKSTVTKPSSQNILSTFKPPQVFKNANLVRSINLEKSYPRDTVNVVIENISPKAQDEYYILFTSSQAERLGNLEVRDKKDSKSPAFAIEAVPIDDPRYYYTATPFSFIQWLTLPVTSSFTKFDCPRPWRQRESKLLALPIRFYLRYVLFQHLLPSRTRNSSFTSSLHIGHPHMLLKSNRPTSSSVARTFRNILMSLALEVARSHPKNQARSLLTGPSMG